MPDTEAHRARRRGSGRIVALVVIAIGVFFLLGNLGFDLALPTDWWAWLILVAAILPLSRAAQAYRAAGRFDGAVALELLNAAVIIIIAVIFLLHLSWQMWWPLFVIYAGLCMLVRQRGREAP